MKHSPMTMRERSLGLLAAFLLVAAASPAVAGVPPQSATAATTADCPAAPLPEVDAEEALVFEVGDMTLAPTGVEQPIALSGSCEEYCMNDRSACVAACPLPFGSPENDACRADCSSAYQDCMRACW